MLLPFPFIGSSVIAAADADAAAAPAENAGADEPEDRSDAGIDCVLVPVPAVEPMHRTFFCFWLSENSKHKKTLCFLF
jgi:hypothetical protein